jgi:hypothetical protein
MEPSQQPTTTVSASTGMFGGRIPSSVAFAVGILLFLLPFAEIKCGSSTIANQSGLGFAMGKEWKTAGSNGMFGDELTKSSSSLDKGEKGNTQIFAIAALALGVLGLLLSFANAKTGGGTGIFTGILSAGALIGLMMDIKKNFNASMSNQAAEKTEQGSDILGFDKFGDTMNNMKPVLDFTPWFYVAVSHFWQLQYFVLCDYVQTKPEIANPILKF